jgi:hypothetical protein
MRTPLTAVELIVLVNDHFEEIYAVWEEMVNEGKDDTTLILAAEEWLRRNSGNLQDYKLVPVGDDRPRCDHGIVFPMSNCAECLRVKVGVLQQQLDATESQRLELDDAYELSTKIDVEHCGIINQLQQRLNMFRAAMRGIVAAPWHLPDAKKRIARVALEIDAEQEKENINEW